jgi:hypothetical protein
MVAYNFQKTFAPLVESGQKRQTLRFPRRRDARPGEPLQLFTGQRTKYCRKLIAPDPTCLDVLPVTLQTCKIDPETAPEGFQVLIEEIQLDLEHLTLFCQADGFKSRKGFWDFFARQYPEVIVFPAFEGIGVVAEMLCICW